MNFILSILFTLLFTKKSIQLDETDCSIDGICTNKTDSSHNHSNLYSKGEFEIKRTIKGKEILYICQLIILYDDLIHCSNTESNELIGKIQQAIAEYQPCEEKNCGCHAATITKSLYPFRDGITKKMIESVHQFGTKYQIIGHKLYRDPSCLFPARCAGIEYFLKANIQKIPDLEMIVNCRDWPQINIRHVSVLPNVLAIFSTE